MASALLALVPLRVEAAALGTHPDWRILRSGMGPRRARIAAARGLAVESPAVAIVGLCAGAAPRLSAGDVVCATELRRAGAAPIEVPGAERLAVAVRRRGLRAHAGPILSVERIAGPADRRAARDDGVVAVDMESAWLADAADGRPLAVLRVVVDTADRRLADPRTAAAGIRALRNLRRAAGALPEWAAAANPQPEAARAYLADDEAAVDVARLAREVRA
jgi:4-hydroxy-3-methylbut-2-enyl diphosphate reductase